LHRQVELYRRPDGPLLKARHLPPSDGPRGGGPHRRASPGPSGLGAPDPTVRTGLWEGATPRMRLTHRVL